MTHSLNKITPQETHPPLQPNLPTMYDLPEEPGLPDYFHFLQPILLFLTFEPTNWKPELVFSAAALNLYYDPHHPQWYKCPDWFGVVGVDKLYQDRDLRRSYVAWQERVNPTVVVELISPGTEEEDFGETFPQANQPPTKWQVYEQILGIPYYFIHNRYTKETVALQLLAGKYQQRESRDGLWLVPEVGLSLGLWEGEFQGVTKAWLRWFTPEGEMIKVEEEKSTHAEKRAIEAEQRAEQLAAKLRELGLDPDELD